ncbi:MAG TPA: hypothetical protein VIF11_15775 [Methylomirabilota bacterium]|jgi:hypothetical protein
MELSTPTLITLASSLAAVVSTWATLGYRVRALEGAAKERAKELESVRTEVGELRRTVEHVRNDQGRRLGELKEAVDQLEGRVLGFSEGFGAGRRSRTSAQGHKIGGGREHG